MTYDFSGADSLGDHTVITTLPEDAAPWEYMLRFIEDSLNAEGWDGYPRLIAGQYTKGTDGGMGALVCLGVPLPPDLFRDNPIAFLHAFYEGLRDDKLGLRAKYGEFMGDSPLVGIVLASEGHGFRGEAGEAEAFYSRARAEGKRFSEYPEAVEVRTVLGIPLGEMKLYNVSRARGEEPEYMEITDLNKIQETLQKSTSHQLALGILLELVSAQAEAQGWPTR